jgi:hypothetical protein
MSREHVRAIVNTAPEVTPEPPRPLLRELPPADPFPVEARGDVLAPAARAIHDRVRAPPAICGQSVIAAATLAVQDARAVNRPQLAPKQIKAPAKKHELPKNLFECGAIDAAKIGDRLEIRLQAAQEPNDLDVAMSFGFQPPARAHSVHRHRCRVLGDHPARSQDDPSLVG